MAKARRSALTGMGDKNNFSVLEKMYVKIKEVEAVGNPERVARCHIIPVKTRMTEEVANYK